MTTSGGPPSRSGEPWAQSPGSPHGATRKTFLGQKDHATRRKSVLPWCTSEYHIGDRMTVAARKPVACALHSPCPSALFSALLLEPLRPRFHEAGVRLLSTLCALRGDNFVHLFHVDTRLVGAGSRRASLVGKNDVADSDRRISASGRRLTRVGDAEETKDRRSEENRGRRSVSGMREENKGEKGEKPRVSITVGRASVSLSPLTLPPPTIITVQQPSGPEGGESGEGAAAVPSGERASVEGPSASPDLPRVSVTLNEAPQAEPKLVEVKVEQTFPEALRWLLESYGRFDVRVVRGEGAAVVREAMRLVAVLCVCESPSPMIHVCVPEREGTRWSHFRLQMRERELRASTFYTQRCLTCCVPCVPQRAMTPRWWRC